MCASRARHPFYRGVHKLHFDNNTELTLSRLRIYHCAPLIEAIDPSKSRITNASLQSTSLSRVLCTLTLNSTMRVRQSTTLLSTRANDNTRRRRQGQRYRIPRSNEFIMFKDVEVNQNSRRARAIRRDIIPQKARIVYRKFIEISTDWRIMTNFARDSAYSCIYILHKWGVNLAFFLAHEWFSIFCTILYTRRLQIVSPLIHTNVPYFIFAHSYLRLQFARNKVFGNISTKRESTTAQIIFVEINRD